MFGSLALRILIVCSVFLILPLFFHSLIMYNQEERLKLKDFFVELDTVAQTKKELFEQITDNQEKVLELIGLLIQDSLTFSPAVLFQEMAKIDGESTFFYLIEAKPSTFICEAPVDFGCTEKESLFLPYMPEIPVEGFHVFINREENQIFSTKSFLLKGQRHLLISGFPVEAMIKKLENSKFLPYPVKVSFLSPSFTTGEKKSLDQVEIKLPLEKSSLFLLVEASKKEAFATYESTVSKELSTLFILILLVGGGGALWLTYRMAKPLNAISKVMKNVEKGHLDSRYHKDWMGFEINVLGHQFNRMIEVLLSHIETIKNERIAKEIFFQELKIGREIQKSILPKDMPHVPGLDISAGFHPAKEVAGDFYDLLVKNEDQLMIAIADAAGKGVSACLYSLCVRSMLRSFDNSFSDLSQVMTRTNNLFCLDTGDTGVFVTAWVGIFDAKKRILHYSCCGHHPAILKHADGTWEELTTEGVALGVIPLQTVETKTLPLSSGDVLILFTDGVLEAHDVQNNLFGKERLLTWLQQTQASSSEKMVEELLDQVIHFSSNVPQHDDLTLMILRVE